MPRHFVLGLAVITTLLALACSERVQKPDLENVDSCERFPNLCPTPEEDFLVHVGATMATAGTYRVEAAQENLVLPRWGGSDGGIVAVDLKAGSAVADLHRTGDGRYAVVLRDGETFFQRTTCRQWTRIQDAEDVLAPFVFTPDEISGAELMGLFEGDATISADLEIQDIGRVTLDIDPRTYRPLRIHSPSLTNNGKPLEWSFSGWGEPVTVPSISADRVGGPGGNPC